MNSRNIWNVRNNFYRFGLRQFETESDSPRNIRTELRVFCHLDVSVRDGLSNYFTVTRLGVARPILHEGEWHAARFKVGDTEPISDRELDQMPVAVHHLVLAAPKRHPLTRLKKLWLRDMSDTAFVCLAWYRAELGWRSSAMLCAGDVPQTWSCSRYQI